MKAKTALFAILSLALGLSASAQASLLEGKIIGFTYYYPTISAPYAGSPNGNYPVDGNVEIGNIVDNNIAQLDISDKNLLISFLPPPFSFMPSAGSFNFASFNGFVIYDVFGTINDFTSVTINAISNMVGFDSSRITFDANHIWINWQGLSYDLNSTVLSLDINQSSSVPEPGSLALLGLGLAAAAAGLRRKR